MKTYTYEDIKKGLLVETYLYFKLLAYVFTPPLSYGAYKIGLSPNQITTFGILLVFPAMYFNLQGHYVAGILVFHLFFLCDAVDGVLARGTNCKSKLGGYLDDLAHLIFHTGFFIAMSFSMYQTGHVRLGILIVLFLILDNLNRAHWELIHKIRADDIGKNVSFNGPDEGIMVKVRNIFLGSFTFPNVLVWMTILIWDLKLLEVYFIYAVIFSSLYFLYTMLKIIRNISRDTKTTAGVSGAEIDQSDG